MRYTIPQLLKNFQFDFASEEGGNQEMEDVVEEFETFVTMRPKGGLMVKISKPSQEEEVSDKQGENSK